MKKLLHHQDTGLFFKKDGGWTQNPADALPVELPQAEALKNQLNLEHVELYYLFNDETVSQWDFTIGLGPPSD